jgi:hypothetical protein
MDGRQALRRLAGLPVLAVDGMLGAAVAGVQLVLLALGAAPGGPLTFRPLDPLGVALIVAQGAALTWRRHPLAVFVAVFVPNTLYYLLSYPPSGFDFGLGVAIWTLAAYASRPVSMLGCGTVLATWLTQWLTGSAPTSATRAGRPSCTCCSGPARSGPGGRFARRVRAAHAAELVAQAERLERDRELEAQRAVAAEWTRIARELQTSSPTTSARWSSRPAPPAAGWTTTRSRPGPPWPVLGGCPWYDCCCGGAQPSGGRDTILPR